MKLTIDYDKCSGHGRCYELAPDLFTDDERGYGQVRLDVVDAAHLAVARLAVNGCPERAINLTDD
jgi:ferredoxin